MDEQLLEEIGLTKGEIKVYLTLLETGETTTGKIIEQAQISSGKIYEILNKLMKKGLVGYIMKDKTKHFSASSPKRILDYLHEKESHLKEKEKELLKTIPELLSLENQARKEHEVKMFQGFKGLQTAIDEAIHDSKAGEVILAMGVFSKRNQRFNFFWPKWHRQRIRKKIRCRLIFSEKDTPYYKIYKKMKYTEVRVIKGVTPAAVDIIGERVLILTHGEPPSCLSIKHPEIVQSFKTFFDSLWGVAKA